MTTVDIALLSEIKEKFLQELNINIYDKDKKIKCVGTILEEIAKSMDDLRKKEEGIEYEETSLPLLRE